MSDEFSFLTRIRPDKGKAQWTQAQYVSTELDKVDGTRVYVMSIPKLMPGTVIFVHGVNSDGEWYREAASQICSGLNKRLGRECLEGEGFDKEARRFISVDRAGKRYLRPIIPFYWGYKLQPGDEQRYPGIFHGPDNAWGGGPFQNGTNNLLQFWQDGFKRHLMGGLLDLEHLNTDITRQLQDAPPRTCFVHAA